MPFQSTPDPSLVSRLLGEHSFEHRLLGFRCHPRWGVLPASLYSVKDVIKLLASRYPRIDPTALVNWLRTVMQDEELANQVAAAVAEETTDRERLLQVRSLLEERLAQCQASLTV